MIVSADCLKRHRWFLAQACGAFPRETKTCLIAWIFRSLKPNENLSPAEAVLTKWFGTKDNHLLLCCRTPWPVGIYSKSQLDMMNSGNFRAMRIHRVCSFPHLLHDGGGVGWGKGFQSAPSQQPGLYPAASSRWGVCKVTTHVCSKYAHFPKR